MAGDKTILIAEPTEMLSSELQPFLAESGINIICLKTLKDTLMNLQKRNVDVLVLDSCLLEEDCAFISIIKGISENVRIIVCAENNTPEFESNVRQKRIFYYHIKSFGAKDLEMAISSAINYSPHHSGGFSHAASKKD